MDGSAESLSAFAIVASSLALLAVALVATWLSGWYAERARRAVAAVGRGACLRPGFGAIHGTAQPLASRPGGLLVSSMLTQVRFGRGAWRDLGRTTTGSPFAVVLDSGEEIELDPHQAIVEADARDVHNLGVSRDVLAHISAGDVVWAIGVLSRPEQHGAGAYRSSVSRRRLIAPRRGHLTITRESPVARWQALADAHKTGTYFAAGVGAMLHLVVYRKCDLAVLVGSAASDVPLHDPHFVPVAIACGLVALRIVAVGWRNGVRRAREGVGL